MDKKIIKLNNGIEVFYKKTPNTPRTALCIDIKSNNPEKTPGTEGLMARLLMQGTKNRTAEQLAEELDSYAIEFSTEAKTDYIRLKFLCLNEDFAKAIELLDDIIKNSTFDDFEKELEKMKGEIIAELDSPKAKVVDEYYKKLFKNHPYGNTNTMVLENIDKISKEEVLEIYNAFLNKSKKVISVVGDIPVNEAEDLISNTFGTLPKNEEITISTAKPVLNENETSEIIKPDTNQAHIIRGWLTETIASEDYPALLLLNIILGSSGLSSRLFLELRDKKGLAYVVRSCYEPFMQCANFYIYIATEPKNIEISLAGFEEEINKIKTIPVSNEELQNAKNNLFGRWAYSRETNNNQAVIYSNYGIMGVGFDFNEKLKERVKQVTPQDIMSCANKCFSGYSMTSILKP